MKPEERDEMLEGFAAAIGRGYGDPQTNFAAFWGLRQTYEPLVRGEFEAKGFTSAPIYWNAFWLQTFPLAPPREPGAFLQRLYAVTTPADDLFKEHRQYRYRHRGNICWQTVGPPGTLKSSINLGIADEDRPFAPGTVAKHVCFDQERAPEMLQAIQPLDFLLMDERTRQAGENSKVSADELANIFDQFRASQKNIGLSSPTPWRFEAPQIVLETFGANFDTYAACALLYYGDLPLGFVTRPGLRKPVWDEYEPVKHSQVKRSEAAAFQDGASMVRVINEVFGKERAVQFLLRRGKPKKKDFQLAFKLYYFRNKSVKTFERIVELALAMCSNWADYKDGQFEAEYGFAPAPGLVQVARLFYKEV